MLYDSTKILLRDILASLEGAGGIGWDDQKEAVSECSYEVHQMARPWRQGYRSDPVNKALTVAIISERATRAIPHVKSMARAIRHKDQMTAVESGKAALAELSGSDGRGATGGGEAAQTQELSRPSASETSISSRAV